MRLKGRVVRIPGVSRVSRPTKGVENFGNIDRRMSKGEKVLRFCDRPRYRGCIDHQGWLTAGTGRRNYVSSMQTLRPETVVTDCERSVAFT